MKVIFKQSDIIAKVLDKQIVSAEAKYRFFYYIIRHNVEDGILLLNTLTLELIFLSDKEKTILSDFESAETNLKHTLIEKYFLVPDDNDDKELLLQVTATIDMIKNIYTAPKLESLVIFTTSDCNARCFYCFERGVRKVSMSDQTAHDVASFIQKKCSNNVHIRWFGGEPLYNSGAIDIISTELRNNNVNYRSSMVTNGYLFDKDIVNRAKHLWNLKRVQITLDGTEKVYNRIKNYIYKNSENPFYRVLNNIDYLLSAEIAVQIRLNMDEHNVSDLFELAKVLVERFHQYKNCSIYVKLLYEDTSSTIQNRIAEKRHFLIQKSFELQNYIDDNMPKIDIETLPKAYRTNFCMADNDSSAMIFADGNLGKCEHYTGDNFYGSIYSDDIDYVKISEFKKMVTVVAECDNCRYRNLCRHPACCTSNRANRCDAFDKTMVEHRIHTKMDNIYRKFIENKSANNE